MNKQAVVTDQAPAAIGPYSQAIRIGDMFYFSGQIPLDPQTGEIVAGDIAIQTERVMQNIAALLGAADLDFAHVVKTTIYLVDMGDFAAVNEVYGRYFPSPAPARACVEVSALPKGVSVEIEWIAAV